jgi:hypothetical protein
VNELSTLNLLNNSAPGFARGNAINNLGVRELSIVSLILDWPPVRENQFFNSMVAVVDILSNVQVLE